MIKIIKEDFKNMFEGNIKVSLQKKNEKYGGERYKIFPYDEKQELVKYREKRIIK